MLSFAAICPHPPAMIPGLKNSSSRKIKKTIHGMNILADEFEKVNPTTVVLVSPHGPMRYDKFTVNLEQPLYSNLTDFGAEKEAEPFFNKVALGEKIFSTTRKLHLPIERLREPRLDYASIIPLLYLTKSTEKLPSLVPLTYNSFDWKMHYNFGKVIGQVIASMEEPIAFIASGDLSHRLSDDAPAGFSPYGKKFDNTLIELLEKNQPEKILGLNPDFCSQAGECGLRSIIIALGVISHKRSIFQQISYENSLGIGHLVGQWRLS